MRFPNKLYKVKESIVVDMIRILENINSPILVFDLFKLTKLDSIDRFIEALDCLYAIGKISYLEQEGLINVIRN